MGTTSLTANWVDVLRHRVTGAVGISLAALVLVPSVGSIVPPAMTQDEYLGRIEFMTTMPDAVFEFKERGLYYASEHGLKLAEWVPTQPGRHEDVPSSDSDQLSVGAELARSLLQISGLKVNRLANTIGVSPTAYHKWLKGEGMSDANMARLKDMRGMLLVLRDIRQGDLRGFLLQETPRGTPLSLLASGEQDMLVGFALRHPAQKALASRLPVVERQVSGISGWLRPVRRRPWIPSALSEDELYQAADRLNPSAENDSVDRELPPGGDDADSYRAYGFIPE